MKRNTILLLAFILLPFAIKANVVLPSFFSDNMVLQRNTDVKLWGWGSPFEEMVIKTGWDNKEYKLKPTRQAYWELIVKTPGAGGPYTISFKGYNEIVLKNVMIGEVWFCSGQSNMEWSANMKIDNAEAEKAKANYPNIRFFTAPKLASPYPQMNLPGKWEVCTPETMGNFSAIGYFFAEHLQEDLKNVPIGIINSSWGGSPAEPWIPEAYINEDPVLGKAAADLTPVGWSPSEPGRIYNAMIQPFIGYKIAGVLWYQGESNVGSHTYDKTLAGLIKSWRGVWGSEFPFYFVQIAPYNYDGSTDLGVVIRDSQRKVLQVTENTGMVVVSDISPADDLHPRNKKTVGQRLANLALSNHYGINKGVVNGPLYKSLKADKNKLTVFFDNAEGLKFKGKTSTLFEVAGDDGIFHKAEAKIKKNTIILTSKDVKKPIKARYGWLNTAQADLFNGAGLPASSFTTE
ncbi:sialate O-acetylesterase [Flavobacterium sp. DGU11]|uniref:Sialate O-acetylesterase n=1 Tax=Flavobacterium arundinis TaxID=3139143 RepID=A0ABU9HU99_9FLAO